MCKTVLSVCLSVACISLLQAVIISLGNKCDLKDSRQVDFAQASKWAQKEKG